MPLGFECRSRLVKQVPLEPTTPRKGKNKILPTPAPNKYDPPQIFCGNAFNHIKRAPAYTFGHNTKVSFSKPVTTPFAPLFNVQNLGKTGPFKITHSVVTPHIEPVGDKTKKPGPAAYAPNLKIRYKRAPAYSMQAPAKPPYQSWDMWTPPPNMYCPDIPKKKPPAYTLGYKARDIPPPAIPGPGEHEPNFNYVKKSKPAFSMGGRINEIKPSSSKSPPPNTYCDNKFNYPKRRAPAPSFGIRHSPYIGQQETYIKSSKLDLATQ